jgi:hypothetical protein
MRVKRTDLNRQLTIGEPGYVLVTCMDIYERLRNSEQSRRLAWQVFQEIRQVLEFGRLFLYLSASARNFSREIANFSIE